MPSPRFIPFFFGEDIAVTIISPLSGATITSSTPNITWSFSPGVQQAYRVRIWSDAAQTTLVYDSGNVVSGSSTHIVPDGTLRSASTYYIVVNIETTEADNGSSNVVSFSTVFTPSVAVVNVTAIAEGNDCDGELLSIPAARIEWDEVVPAGNETFQRYSIWRRARLHPRHPDAGSELWERVASAVAVNTTLWRDHCAVSRTVYEYAVTWTAVTSLGDTRTSERQTSPANTRLQFERVILHDVTNPDLFVIIPVDAVDVSAEQSSEFRQVWGRKAPTAFISEFEWAQISLRVSADLHSGIVWRDLRGLQQAQGLAHTLCLRLGYRGERYFAALQSPLSRSDGQQQYQTSINLSETFYEEVVA